MDAVTTKTQILDLIQSERLNLEAALASVPPGKLTSPIPELGWSVKDILAHLTAWEQLMLGWVQASLRGETPERPAPGESWDDLDGMNERLRQAHQDHPLAVVQADFQKSYQAVLQIVSQLSEADLLDPQRFEWREGDPLWHMVAANTWWHYKQHCQPILDWLGASNR